MIKILTEIQRGHSLSNVFKDSFYTIHKKTINFNQQRFKIFIGLKKSIFLFKLIFFIEKKIITIKKHFYLKVN